MPHSVGLNPILISYAIAGTTNNITSSLDKNYFTMGILIISQNSDIYGL